MDHWWCPCRASADHPVARKHASFAALCPAPQGLDHLDRDLPSQAIPWRALGPRRSHASARGYPARRRGLLRRGPGGAGATDRATGGVAAERRVRLYPPPRPGSGPSKPRPQQSSSPGGPPRLPGVADLLPQLSARYRGPPGITGRRSRERHAHRLRRQRRLDFKLFPDPATSIDPRHFQGQILFAVGGELTDQGARLTLDRRAAVRCGRLRLKTAVEQQVEITVRDRSPGVRLTVVGSPSRRCCEAPPSSMSRRRRW
jgi:hypothetical protein